MRGPRPIISLLLLLLAAILVLAAGVVAARRVTVQRVPADRALLMELGRPLLDEIHRLDAVFTAHVVATAEAAVFLPEKEVGPLCQTIQGMHGCYRLGRTGPPKTLFKLPGSAPDPKLVETSASLVTPFTFPIPREKVFGKQANGWLAARDPAWRAYYVRMEADTVLVFLVDCGLIWQKTNANLETMLSTAWLPIKAAGELAAVECPKKRWLAGGKPAGMEAADLVFPLPGQFGTWQIVSWDRKSSTASLDPSVLLTFGLVSLILACLGVLVFNLQKKALQEVLTRVSFVNRVSHEIGTPLTNINLYLDLAREHLAEADPAACERRLAIAQEESARLGRMVGNVLTFARSERDQLKSHPAPCQPAAIIRAVLEQFSPSLARRQIAVETTLDEELRTVLDPDLLTQIVANLVSNVEKYAADGKRLIVTLARHTASPHLTLGVRDFGPGIPASQLDRVLRPFERLHSKITEGVTGAGLGLAIVQDLTHRLGGRLSIKNMAEGGMLFEVSLPITATA